MLRVGLTGGIAAGKSTVCAWFRAHGVPVMDADQAARAVVLPGSPGLAAVVGAFGTGVLDAAGALDRRRLRRRVFADAAARRRLEAILHPLIHAHMQTELARAEGPYAVLDLPLLAEQPALRAGVDRVLVVDVPEAVQLARLMARDAMTEADARAMLAAQASRAQRLRGADDVVDNSGDVAALGAQLEKLHKSYLKLARGRRSR